MMVNRVLVFTWVLALGVAWQPPCLQAVTIVPTFVNSAGCTWDSVKQGVVQQAIQEWNACVLDNQVINVTFDFTNAGSSTYLGQWEGTLNVLTGTDVYPWTSDVTHTIHFNADISGTWWDPTPTTSSDLPFSSWDALSVARHELGHCLGFTPNFYRDNIGVSGQDLDKWTSHVTGTTFNLGSLGIPLTSDLAHVEDSGLTADDLMTPSLPNGARHGISAIDMDMLELAYGYQVISQLLPGDANLDGSVNGSDLNAVLSNYNQSGMYWSDGNFNDDYTVNGTDLNTVLSNYNQSLSMSSAVPEPSTVLLAVTALMLLALVKRRGKG